MSENQNEQMAREAPTLANWASKTSALRDENRRLAVELDNTRRELVAHREKAQGNYWAWQGDGHDYPESLVCPILISAEQMRRLLAELDALRKDKERLDWLATKASVTFVHYAASGYVIATSRDGETKSHQMLSDDLRTALDSVMKEKNV